MKIIQENKSDVLGFCKGIGYVVVPKERFKQDEVTFVTEAKLRTQDGRWVILSPKGPDFELKYWSSLNDVYEDILNRREKYAV